MNIAIVGYGIEGEQNYRYFADQGHTVTIIDEHETPAKELPKGAKAVLGANAFAGLDEYDIVVRTAGLAPRKLQTKAKIWSATNEFFAKCPAPIIGVTGTKGKGTTSSLITEILRASGQKVHLVGNIGVPALQVLSDVSASDVIVYEMSSFQLWDLEKSPMVAVILMIEPDHLDVHADMDEYVRAKANIARYQDENNIAIYHPTNRYAANIAHSGKGKAVRYGIPDDGQVYVRSNTFFVQNTAICNTDALQIPGVFNQDNACAAISAALAVGADIRFVEAGLRAFRGLPHRLKYVRTVNDVQYYDDSIATTPGSAIAALKTFKDKSVIILGGSDKGASYDEVVVECKAQGARVIAVGQTGERIVELCQAHGVAVTRETGLMIQVVSVAQRIAQPGDIVILSPASASFDQYKSYSDRGDQFTRAVEEL